MDSLGHSKKVRSHLMKQRGDSIEGKTYSMASDAYNIPTRPHSMA